MILFCYRPSGGTGWRRGSYEREWSEDFQTYAVVDEADAVRTALLREWGDCNDAEFWLVRPATEIEIALGDVENGYVEGDLARIAIHNNHDYNHGVMAWMKQRDAEEKEQREREAAYRKKLVEDQERKQYEELKAKFEKKE